MKFPSLVFMQERSQNLNHIQAYRHTLTEIHNFPKLFNLRSKHPKIRKNITNQKSEIFTNSILSSLEHKRKLKES